jgi:hypothetical protein
MEAIYKTFFGNHIDLSKVISISDAKFIGEFDFNNHQNWFVEFEIFCQLADKPIRHKRLLTANEIVFRDHSPFLRCVDGQEVKPFCIGGAFLGNVLCVANLQNQINELVNIWRQYKSLHG